MDFEKLALFKTTHPHRSLLIGITFKRGPKMSDQTNGADQSGVDKGLVAMFLRMSPEERLRVNDSTFRTILELRDSYRRLKDNERKPG